MNSTWDDEPATVLVVEDDRHLVHLIARWLDESYEVLVAHDCETAYTLFDEPVDVALLDRCLPDGSGDEILTELRRVGLDWRVAMVTAELPSIDAVELGFDEYLCKPVTREGINAVVERLVAQANYGEALTEFYALSAKKALLERHYEWAELDASEEYAALEARFAELQDELNTMACALSDTQLMAELAQLQPESDSDSGPQTP